VEGSDSYVEWALMGALFDSGEFDLELVASCLEARLFS
jgi:hypothetical protein